MNERNTNPSRRPSANAGQRGTYHQRERTTVPSAREELERERELYSSHDPRRGVYAATERPSRHRAAEAGQTPRSSAARAGAAPNNHRPTNERERTASHPHGSPNRRPSARSAAPNSDGKRAEGPHTHKTTVSAASYGADRYRTKRDPYRGGFNARHVLVALGVVVAVGAGGFFGYTAWADAQPIDVTVNGETKTIQGDQRSIQGMLDGGVVSVTPGNYLAVDGSVMRQGEGTRATASINGEAQDDLGKRLSEGDSIDISNGVDVTEPYTDSDVQTLGHKVKIVGTGAVHVYQGNGQDGEKVTRTGSESGITTEVTTKEAVDETVQCYNVDSKGDKVVALTFDDGPWDKQTSEILDILKENDAKATFFTVGQVISGREDVVKRAFDEGHEISTHTYDHAEGSGQGVSLIKMSDQERKDEVTKGYEAIKKATGQDASTVFRSPGGNFDDSVATSLDGIITSEIGWNIDTTDWQKPGADVIAQRIAGATGGNIILMHDGGGDRSQTIAGLRQALPKLKEEGYTFVTVQELLDRYPYQGEQQS